MKKGVIATDLDGTLTANKRELEPEIKAFLEDLQASGWELLFLTGRYYAYARELLQTCSFPYYLGVQNGTALMFPEEEKCFFSHKLSFECVPFLKKIINGFSVASVIESGVEHDDLYFRELSSTLEKEEILILEAIENIYFPNQEARDRRFKKVFSLEDAYPFGDLSVIKILGRISVLEDIREILVNSDFFSVISVSVIAHPFHSQFSIMHITPKEGTKESALSYFLANVSQNEPFVITAGDDFNDEGFLNIGSFKIVMETAPKMMHGLADCLCPSAKRQGILYGLRKGIEIFERKFT
ncbi:MAG: HAD family hydrolase [Victivallaceae bacterium]